MDYERARIAASQVKEYIKAEGLWYSLEGQAKAVEQFAKHWRVPSRLVWAVLANLSGLKGQT